MCAPYKHSLFSFYLLLSLSLSPPLSLSPFFCFFYGANQFRLAVHYSYDKSVCCLARYRSTCMPEMPVPIGSANMVFAHIKNTCKHILSVRLSTRIRQRYTCIPSFKRHIFMDRLNVKFVLTLCELMLIPADWRLENEFTGDTHKTTTGTTKSRTQWNECYCVNLSKMFYYHSRR